MRSLVTIFTLLLSVNAFALEIRSDAFEKGGSVPIQYTCDSKDVSPAVSWTDVPSGTKSFVLICDDPDAPVKTWTHWVMFNIPQDKNVLSEAVPKVEKLDDGSIQGINDFGKFGYGGPCPPSGKPHRYFFRLYALDTNLSLDKNATKDSVLKAIKGHLIASAETFGMYGR